ncbi:MAG: hypothetical protein KDC90_06970, partial [Ignavibacteriae bacterium]|nr:hypothetical protein [Ignavibacteriota bacterium]
TINNYLVAGVDHPFFDYNYKSIYFALRQYVRSNNPVTKERFENEIIQFLGRKTNIEKTKETGDSADWWKYLNNIFISIRNFSNIKNGQTPPYRFKLLSFEEIITKAGIKYDPEYLKHYNKLMRERIKIYKDSEEGNNT